MKRYPWPNENSINGKHISSYKTIKLYDKTQGATEKLKRNIKIMECTQLCKPIRNKIEEDFKNSNERPVKSAAENRNNYKKP